MHARVLGRASKPKPEARDHLVEKQKRAMFFRDAAQKLQKPFFRRHHTHVGRHRLHHHRRYPSVVFFHQRAHGLLVIVDCRQSVRRISRRHTRAVRLRLGHQPGTRFHQQTVGMAVVIACKLDDLLTARESSRHSHGTHHCLRTGTDQTHHLHIGHTDADQFRKFHFPRCGRAESQPVRTGSLHRLHHFRMRMSQNARPPGADIIQISVSVRIKKPRSLRLLHKEGMPAHRAKRPHRGIDPAGDSLLRSVEKLFRSYVFHRTPHSEVFTQTALLSVLLPRGGLQRMIGNDNLRARPLHGREILQYNPSLVNPSVGGGRFHHGVLPAHIVHCKRHIERERRLLQNIQIGEGRFDHHNVRPLLYIRPDFPQRLLPVGAVHLIAFAVAEARRRVSRIPERSVIGGGKFRAVSHDRRLGKACPVEPFPYGRHPAVHHIRGRCHIRTGLHKTHRHLHQIGQRLVV